MPDPTNDAELIRRFTAILDRLAEALRELTESNNQLVRLILDSQKGGKA